MDDFKLIDTSAAPNIKVTVKDDDNEYTIKRMFSRVNDTGSNDLVIETNEGKFFSFTNLVPMGVHSKAATEFINTGVIIQMKKFKPTARIKEMADKILGAFGC